MAEYNWNDIDLGKANDHLADALGSFIINFAYLNSVFDDVVSHILDLSQKQKEVLIIPLQPREKLKIIRGYFKNELKQNHWMEIKELLKNCDTVLDYRNSISHSYIVNDVDNNGVILYDFSGNKRFSPKKTKIKSKDLAHNAIHTLQLGKRIQHFFENSTFTHASSSMPISVRP